MGCLFFVCLFCSGIPNLASSLEHQNGQLELQKPSGSGLKSKMLNRSAETSPSPSLSQQLQQLRRSYLKLQSKKSSSLIGGVVLPVFFFPVLFCFLCSWPSEPDHEPSYRKYPVELVKLCPRFLAGGSVKNIPENPKCQTDCRGGWKEILKVVLHSWANS